HRGLNFGIPNLHLDPGWYRAPDRDRDRAVPLRLVFVGSLEQRYKGLHVLLESLAQLPRTTATWHLDVVGDGAFRGEAMTQARSLGIADQITWHGAIAREAVRQVLHAGTVFVMPSLTEG